MTQTFINIHLRDGRVLQFLPAEKVWLRDWQDGDKKSLACYAHYYNAIKYRGRFRSIHYTISIQTDFTNPFPKPRRHRALRS